VFYTIINESNEIPIEISVEVGFDPRDRSIFSSINSGELFKELVTEKSLVDHNKFSRLGPFTRWISPALRSFGMKSELASHITTKIAVDFLNRLSKKYPNLSIKDPDVNSSELQEKRKNFNPLKYDDPFFKAVELASSYVAGEEENLRLILAALFSKDLEKGRQINLMITGPSGTGKTTLMNAALKVFPESHYKLISRATDAAFEYSSDELRHTVLAFSQFPVEQTKSDTIHVLTSEGELRILVTMKDEETGLRKVVERRAEGPVVLIGAIVDEKLMNIDEQMKTRTLFIYPNPTHEQTVTVLRFLQNRRRYFYVYDLIEEELKAFREWYDVFTSFSIRSVYNLFFPLIGINPTIGERIRRDAGKIESIIDVLAYVRQGRRFIFKLTKKVNGGEKTWYVVLPSIKDLKDGMEIIKPALTNLSAQISPQMREALMHMKVLQTFTRSDLMRVMGKSRTTVRKIIDNLMDLGYVELLAEGKGRKGHVYVVAKTPGEEEVLYTPQELLEMDEEEVLKMFLSLAKREFDAVEVLHYTETGDPTPVNLGELSEEEINSYIEKYEMLTEDVQYWMLSKIRENKEKVDQTLNKMKMEGASAPETEDSPEYNPSDYDEDALWSDSR